jgi:hypothetical protein
VQSCSVNARQFALLFSVIANDGRAAVRAKAIWDVRHLAQRGRHEQVPIPIVSSLVAASGHEQVRKAALSLVHALAHPFHIHCKYVRVDQVASGNRGQRTSDIDGCNRYCYATAET